MEAGGGSLGRPCLRPLEAIPIEQQGEVHIVWRDPAGLAATVEVPQPVALLMSLMDGHRDLTGLRAAWLQLSGEDLPVEFLSQMAAELDEHLLLDTPRFRAAREEVLARYRSGPRQPAHLGAYPEQPADCAAYLESLLDGLPGAGAPRGLVAPHVDLLRGGPCYGAAYAALRASTADLFVVIGIAHGSCCWPEPPPLVTLTRVDFATPLGVCRTDTAVVDRLAADYAAAGGDPDDLFRDELVHRTEHSVEFQMLFLQHLHGRRDFRVLPILTGSLHEFHDRPEALPGAAGLGRFVAVLRQAIAEYPGEVCVVAGADLSHVGPRFGQPEPVDQARLAAVRSGDGAALTALESGPDEWFAHFAADGNARNVCSVSNLYVLRSLLPSARITRLGYEVAYDPHQTVSFAALALD